MKLIVFLATAWGTRFGGVNVFNMDLCLALGKLLKTDLEWRIYCVVPYATPAEIESARMGEVLLIALDKTDEHPDLDGREQDIWNALQSSIVTPDVSWWIGHDYISGGSANKIRTVSGMGSSAVIMHMSPIDYMAPKHRNSRVAVEKNSLQVEVFRDANRRFAVGPMLADRLTDMLRGCSGGRVTVLIPGLPDIVPKDPPHIFGAITFGRLNREDDLIKQGRLAVEAFATAVRKAHEQAGMPANLKNQPRMYVVGIETVGGSEENEIRDRANTLAGRTINLIAVPFTENRDALMDEVSNASLALMPSWHEGFGLTGWEAIAAGVPLVISKQSGLFQYLFDTFGRQATGCLDVVDIHGSQQIDRLSPDRQRDIEAVSAAILEVAANYVSKHRDALALRKFLYDRDCTWPNTARVFLRGLEISFEGEEGESVAPGPTTHLFTHRRQGLLLRSREGQALESAKPLRSKIYDFVQEESDGRCELCYRRYQIPDIHTALIDDDHDSVLNLLALCNKCAERVRECPDPLPILKSISERVRDRRRTKAPVWFYCERCQSGDIELGEYTDEVKDDQFLTVRCNQCGWDDWTDI